MSKMVGKHDTTAEPSRRRPLALKLSGLITRHSSTKGKKSPVTATVADEKASVFKFKRQRKTLSPEIAPEFEPLEVDLAKLEAFRLSEGWLETQTRDPDHDRTQQEQHPPPPTTPIADLFSNKSVLDVSASVVELGPSFSSLRTRTSSRPFSMIETQRPIYIDDTPATGSILDRGRPVESRRYVSDPLKKTKGLRNEPTPQDGTAAVGKITTPEYPPLERPHQDGSSSVTTESSTALQPQPPKIVGAGRHSMHAGVTPSLKKVPETTGAAQAPTSTSAMPLERIQTWRKSVTSSPMSAASSTSSLASTQAAAALPSQAPAPTARRVSTRGGVGNRLAWIRELEEKKSGSLSRDIGVLKKQAGSVSDKLAMFEGKKGLTAPSASRLPPLTRSNSTASRLSSAALSSTGPSSTGLESTSSTYGSIAASPRTSIDTIRSSHRASSVMSFYDDSFREKMETVVSGYATDKDGRSSSSSSSSENTEKKSRITAQFVSVKPSEKMDAGAVSPRTCQPEAGPSSVAATESEKGE